MRKSNFALGLQPLLLMKITLGGNRKTGWASSSSTRTVGPRATVAKAATEERLAGSVRLTAAGDLAVSRVSEFAVHETYSPFLLRSCHFVDAYGRPRHEEPGVR